MKNDYRIALRPYEEDRGRAPDEWDDVISPPLDDIVVKNVSCFRMEDMGDHFWMSCYLGDSPDDERITFTVRLGRRGEPRIVVEACEFPDVKYETD